MKSHDDSRREMNEGVIQELEKIIAGIRNGTYLPLNFSFNVGVQKQSMDGVSMSTVATIERYISLEYLDLSEK